MSGFATTDSAQLLEREHALEALRDALAAAAAGSGRTVLVTGEAGIGKTTLVRHFEEAVAGDVRVLRGACEALFTPRPLGPVHDIARVVGGPVADLLARAPDRTTLLAALLSELGSSRTVAVFEDVHWADEATLDALKYLSRRVDVSTLLLVLTYRDDEVGPQHPLRLLLGDLPARTTTRVTLAPLSEAAVDELAEQAGRPSPELHATTGGNPFFVTEVLAAAGAEVPATVRDAVLARALGLPAEARDVLDLASVVPGRIEHRLVADVLSPAPESVSACIERGVLVAEPDALTFRHELARRAVLEALEPWRRSTLDRHVLEALEAWPERDELLSRLAHHAEALADREAILRYAPAAAERASAVGAHREAWGHYAHAVRMSDHLPAAERARLLDAYAHEGHQVGRLDDAVEAREAAVALWRECGEPRRESESLSRASSIYVLLGRDAEGEEIGRRAIEVLGGEPECVELALAYRTQSGLRMLQRDTEEAVAWGEKATALAERLGDTETLIGAGMNIGAALVCASQVSRGLEPLRRSMELAREAGHDMLLANAYVQIGSASGEVYELELARETLEEGIEFARARDLDYARDYQLAWLGLTLAYLGRWDEAGRTAAQVLGRASGGAISRIMALLTLGRLRARRGDPGAEAALDEALELASQTGTLQRLAPVHAARAECAWLAGDAQRTAAEA
ncbi:MAG TPA: AAA family ATPase, partial [Gaiellaceae bacterium]|nr:AAA family ATPase [Gaiellaceae bacterium]